jgi:hypothetical protein
MTFVMPIDCRLICLWRARGEYESGIGISIDIIIIILIKKTHPNLTLHGRREGDFFPIKKVCAAAWLENSLFNAGGSGSPAR